MWRVVLFLCRWWQVFRIPDTFSHLPVFSPPMAGWLTARQELEGSSSEYHASVNGHAYPAAASQRLFAITQSLKIVLSMSTSKDI